MLTFGEVMLGGEMVMGLFFLCSLLVSIAFLGFIIYMMCVLRPLSKALKAVLLDLREKMKEMD